MEEIFGSESFVRCVLSKLGSIDILSSARVSKLFYRIAISKQIHETGLLLTTQYKPHPYIPMTQMNCSMDDFDFSNLNDGGNHKFSLVDVPTSSRDFVCSLVHTVTLFPKHTNIRYSLPNLKIIRSIGGSLDGIRPLDNINTLEFLSMKPQNAIRSCRKLTFPNLIHIEIIASQFFFMLLKNIPPESVPNLKAVRVPTPTKEIIFLNSFPQVKILQVWNQIEIEAALENIEVLIVDNFHEPVYDTFLKCFPKLKKVICHKSSMVNTQNENLEILKVERDYKQVKIDVFNFLEEN